MKSPNIAYPIGERYSNSEISSCAKLTQLNFTCAGGKLRKSFVQRGYTTAAAACIPTTKRPDWSGGILLLLQGGREGKKVVLEGMLR
jgi:hypothetical protein